MSVVDDVFKVVSLDAKMSGDLVYLLGETHDELGGSEYFSMTQESNETVPQVNTAKNKKTYIALSLAITKQLVASSIGIGRGGLAVALAKKAIGGQLGLSISLQKLNGNATRNDYALYSESQGRILITVAKENKVVFEKLMKEIPYQQIGTVTKERKLTVSGLEGKEIVNLDLKKITEAYRETFKNY